MEIITKYENFNESYSTNNQTMNESGLFGENKSNYIVGVFLDSNTVNGKYLGKVVWQYSSNGLSAKCDIVFVGGEFKGKFMEKLGVAKGGGYDKKTASFFDALRKNGVSLEGENTNDMYNFLKAHGYFYQQVF